MGLLQDWQAVAFNENADRGQLQNFWSRYFAIDPSGNLWKSSSFRKLGKGRECGEENVQADQ